MSAGASESTNKPRVRDGVGFFRSFLQNPTSIGAVLPSSRYLARSLVGRLDTLKEGELVVEFGPGTGPMTAVIRDTLPPGVDYLGIELNASFHDLLVNRFPRMDFHLGSAADVIGILEGRGLPRPARILSGLPFASLADDVQKAVVDGILASLRGTEGEFRTFQYVHAYQLRAARRFRALMAERFDGFERVGPIVRNVPPAFVLRYWHAK